MEWKDIDVSYIQSWLCMWNVNKHSFLFGVYFLLTNHSYWCLFGSQINSCQRLKESKSPHFTDGIAPSYNFHFVSLANSCKYCIVQWTQGWNLTYTLASYNHDTATCCLLLWLQLDISEIHCLLQYFWSE